MEPDSTTHDGSISNLSKSEDVEPVLPFTTQPGYVYIDYHLIPITTNMLVQHVHGHLRLMWWSVILILYLFIIFVIHYYVRLYLPFL